MLWNQAYAFYIGEEEPWAYQPLVRVLDRCPWRCAYDGQCWWQCKTRTLHEQFVGSWHRYLHPQTRWPRPGQGLSYVWGGLDLSRRAASGPRSNSLRSPTLTNLTSHVDMFTISITGLLNILSRIITGNEYLVRDIALINLHLSTI